MTTIHFDISKHDAEAMQEIENCLVRHNRGRDTRDPLLLKSVYHSDADLSFGSTVTADAWIEQICTSPATLRSSHRIANPYIRVDGCYARSEAPCIAHVLLPQEDGQRFLCGRYLDRHEERGEGWRIAHRTFIHDWTVDLPMGDTLVANHLAGVSPADALDGPDRSPADRLVGTVLGLATRAADRGDEPGLLAVTDPVLLIDRAGPDRETFRINEHPDVEWTGEGAWITSDALTISRDRKSRAEDCITVTKQRDFVVLRNGAWVIAAREITGTRSASCPATSVDLPFERGRADRFDPSYAFWQ